jgi:hypothetical protein
MPSFTTFRTRQLIRDASMYFAHDVNAETGSCSPTAVSRRRANIKERVCAVEWRSIYTASSAKSGSI